MKDYFTFPKCRPWTQRTVSLRSRYGGSRILDLEIVCSDHYFVLFYVH